MDWEKLRAWGREEYRLAAETANAICAGGLSPVEAAGRADRASDDAEARRVAAGWSDEEAIAALDMAAGETLRNGLHEPITVLVSKDGV